MKNYILLIALVLINCQKSIGQVSWGFNSFNTTADYLGWDATTGSPPLNIKTTNNDPINFYSNYGAFNSSRMTILGGNNSTGGFVGIGYGLAPSFQLDVNAEINIASPTFNSGRGSYMLDSKTILTEFASNLIIGWGAGQSSTGGTGNTFAGNNAGFSNIATSANTFLGFETGYAHIGNGGNTFLGWYAGRDAISTAECVFIGTRAGQPNNGASNIMIGVSSGQFSDDGDGNVFVGHQSGYNNGIAGNATVGNENVFIGEVSGKSNTSGNFNTFIGAYSGENAVAEHNLFMGYRAGRATTRNNNVFGGYLSGEKNTTGANNVFLGSNSGNTNLTGGENTFIGTNAGFANNDDIGNTFIGYHSGIAFNAGTHNVYVGHSAGLTPTIGDINTLIGYNTHHNDDVDNSTALGANADVVTSNDMILGDNNVNVGIGLSGIAGGPLTKLQLLGTSGAQFRVSYDYTTGKHSDFETTSGGLLKINPSSNYSGFNLPALNNPTNTVEIYATVANKSGLTFSRLNSGSPVAFSTNGKLLTVNPSGEVVLADDIGGGNVMTSCSSAPDKIARFDAAGTTIQCSDIYNNASSATNRIGFFTILPQYKFQNEGTALFTNTSVIAPIGMYAGANTAPLIVNSYQENEGISILHSSSFLYYKDLLKIYADNGNASYPNSPLYHFRTQKYTDYPGYGNVTFDHAGLDNEGKDAVSSWLGYNTFRRFAVMKDDFNTNYFAPAITAFGGSVITGNHAKFYIEAQTRNFSTNLMTYGLVVNNTSTGLEGYKSAVFGYMDVTRSANRISNRGGMFFVTGATGDGATNIGVYGVAQGTGQGSINMGGWFSGYRDGDNNYGVYCSAADGANLNYGIYSVVPTSTCTTSGPCPSAAGFFDGSVYTTDYFYDTSDSTLKTNILPFNDDSLLRTVPIHTFDYLTQNPYGLTLPQGNHYGVLAQEVEQIFPNLIRMFRQPEVKDSLGNIITQGKDIKAVNYDEFIPLLIAAYQKQADKLDSLLGTIQPAARLAQTTSNNGGQLTVELENIHAIVLNQNEPNPFAEQTTITWNIPAQDNGILNAMLMFYDNTGTIIKTVKINETGAGSLLVYGSKLSTGIYTYSLVVNNKTIDSKKMMKTK